MTPAILIDGKMWLSAEDHQIAVIEAMNKSRNTTIEDCAEFVDKLDPKSGLGNHIRGLKL